MAKTDTADYSARGFALGDKGNARGSRSGACAHGDVEALSTYFSDHRDQLHGYARSIVHDHCLAEDVVQQAYLNSVQALSRGTEIRNVSGWLHRVIHNLALKEIAGSRCEPLDRVADLPSPRGTAERVESREQMNALKRAADSMPEKLRTAFLLADVRGFNYKEIAAALESSTGSARQLLHRARVQMRELAAVERLPLVSPLYGLIVASRAGHWMRGLREKMAGRLVEVANWVSPARHSVEHLAGPATVPVTAVIAVAVVGGMAGAHVDQGPARESRAAQAVAARSVTPAGLDRAGNSRREATRATVGDHRVGSVASQVPCGRSGAGTPPVGCAPYLVRRCGPGSRGFAPAGARQGARCAPGRRLRARAASARFKRRPARRPPGVRRPPRAPQPFVPRAPGATHPAGAGQPRPGLRPPGTVSPAQDATPFPGPPVWPVPVGSPSEPPGGVVPADGGSGALPQVPKPPPPLRPRPPHPPADDGTTGLPSG